MHDITVRGREGGANAVPGSALEELDGAMRGAVRLPGDEGYEEARTIWNAMIDRRPAVVARCRGHADVARAVRFARDHDALVCVKGGGHNVAGNAVHDDALMIDLSEMDSVRVEPGRGVARVGAGAILADLDHEAQAFGLATPVGYNSTTGIAGLTLGGGFGWLSRKHGMTIDNLLSVDLVTAEGETVFVDQASEPDLFWGVRGGGGNFGVVTSFEFRLHEVGPTVLAGPIVYRWEEAPAVLRNLRDFNAAASDETTCWAVLRKAPPLPFLDDDVVGEDVVIVAAFCAGDMEAGEKALAPLRAFGDPVADAIGPHPYAGFQKAFDPLNEPGARNYWKSHNFETLTDEAIDILVERAREIPNPGSEIALAQLGGAMGRVDPTATAFPHREADWLMNTHTHWSDPDLDEACIGFTRELYDALTPLAMGGAYVNFITEDGGERGAYRENWERLRALKREWDPDNVFRTNQNVPPAE